MPNSVCRQLIRTRRCTSGVNGRGSGVGAGCGVGVVDVQEPLKFQVIGRLSLKKLNF